MELGWRVLVVWECAIKGRRRLPENELIREISEWILCGEIFKEIPRTL